MATLQGQEIKDTYQALLKTDGNTVISSSLQAITDGQGNATVLSLSTEEAQIEGGFLQGSNNVNLTNVTIASVSSITYTNLGTGSLGLAFTGSADDAFLEVTFPFTVNFLGVEYTSSFIGSNSYLTFGQGSTEYNNLGPSNPPFPSIQIDAADKSYQRVYTGSEDGGLTYRIRYEGSDNTAPPTTVIYSYVFYSGSSQIDLYIDELYYTFGSSGISNGSIYVGILNIVSGSQYAFSILGNATSAVSHAEGTNTTSIGYASHAEGVQTTAIGYASHTEGYQTISPGLYSHAEGFRTTSKGGYSHAEGGNTTSKGGYSHAEGYYTTSIGDYSHAEGQNATSIGNGSHAEGGNTTAIGGNSHAEGQATKAIGQASHTEGFGTTAVGNYNHAEGYLTTAIGPYSHTEGNQTTTVGYGSHAEGNLTATIGYASHAEGAGTTSIGFHSHTEGQLTTTIGYASHAEGYTTISSGSFSHAEGGNTTSIGDYSHTEGYLTTSVGPYNHAEGLYTIASGSNFPQHAEGRYNIPDTTSLLIIGNGTADNARSNAFSIATFGTNNIGSTAVLPFVSQSLNYANDAAAAAGGIPLGGLYHSSGTIKIRLV